MTVEHSSVASSEVEILEPISDLFHFLKTLKKTTIATKGQAAWDNLVTRMEHGEIPEEFATVLYQ